MRFRRLVDELIERERDEVDEHDLDHGAQTRLRGTDRNSADRTLADRRVAHPLGPELLGQPSRCGVGAALGDILAEHNHTLVDAHRVRQRLVDRLDEGGLHERHPGRSSEPA
jgi:hypothetical protein